MLHQLVTRRRCASSNFEASVNNMQIRHDSHLPIVIIFALIALSISSATFSPSSLFRTYQTRLTPYQTGPLSIYSLPNPGYDNLTYTQLVLSGYDLPQPAQLQFQVQLGLEQQPQSFQILLKTVNETRFYFLNFFILGVSPAGSEFIGLQTCNYTFSLVDPFGQVATRRVESRLFDSPFYRTGEENITAVAMLKSMQTIWTGNGQGVLNITEAGILPNSSTLYLTINNTNNYLVEAVIVAVIIRQPQFRALQLSTYEYSSLILTLNSSSTAQTISTVSKAAFNINYKYGATLQPKCMVGFQKIHTWPQARATFSFNFTLGGVTQLAASSNYFMQYSFVCVADIQCQQSGMQYYHLIGDCEPTCSINNCEECFSSTSCLNCELGYFVNGLFRCSQCPNNCQSCPNERECQTCTTGFYSDRNGQCLICPIFCQVCPNGRCQICQVGFTPSSGQCMSCATAMTDCLECSSVSVCTLCREGYFYDSNNRRCSACGSSMPDCKYCDLRNNCLQCQAGFYKQAFNRCQRCTHEVAQCCPNYVENCLACSSQVACQSCQVGYYLNAQNRCSSCAGLYDVQCEACNSTACVLCSDGYYLQASGCLPCNTTIGNCVKCDNSTTCTQCVQPYQVRDSQCVNCSSWPLNDLFYLDDSNTCQTCQSVIHNCRSCSDQHTCTECLPLYYLQSSSCLACVGLIENCLTCRNGVCRQCYEGFYLSGGACVTCGNQLQNCIACDHKGHNSGVKCTRCHQGYKLKNDVCTQCKETFEHCLICSSFGCLTCEQSFYPSSEQRCVTCPQTIQGCTECLTKTQCLSCSDGYYLFGGYCTACSLQTPHCHTCQLSSPDNTFSCHSCLSGYYLSLNQTCLSCTDIFQFCHTCTAQKCFSCIPGYYVTAQGNCLPCRNLVDNCEYCSSDLKCLSCAEDYLLNSASGDCQACWQLSQGCQSCSSAGDRINCTQCKQNYLPYNTTTNTTACLACNTSMPYCHSCTSLSSCTACVSTAFLNPLGTCSLCSQYQQNCKQCNDSQECTLCDEDYGLDVNGSCVSCHLSQFGTSPLPLSLPLCKRCQINHQAQCQQCQQGYYLAPDAQSCITCQGLVDNCFSCLNPSKCLQCQSSYYLSVDNTQCFPCGLNLCKTCTPQGQCQQCQPTAVLLTSGECQSCSLTSLGCHTCDANGCLSCQDGYFFSQQSCQKCQNIAQHCVLCSPSECFIKSAPTSDNEESQPKYYIPLFITALVLSVGLIVAIVFFYKKWMSNQDEQINQEEGKTDTSRRMGPSELFVDEVEVAKGKKCQSCQSKPNQIMQLELLCRKCEKKKRRGHSHKIRQPLNKKQSTRQREGEQLGLQSAQDSEVLEPIRPSIHTGKMSSKVPPSSTHSDTVSRPKDYRDMF